MMRRIFTAALLIAGVILPAASAHAQGCILCYTSALAAGKSVEDALRNGVLLLLVPVASLLIGIAVMAWRKAPLSSDPEPAKASKVRALRSNPGAVVNSEI